MDRLGKAAGIAAQKVPEFFMKENLEKEKKLKTEKENETLKKLTGIDFGAIQEF